MTTHEYTTKVSWEGSTGEGYRTYDRSHHGEAPPVGITLPLSADPHFRGDAARLNPEQLLVMAASSCQLLTFIALAARDGIDVHSYDDEAYGTMDDRDPPARVGTITLSPTIRVAAGTDPEHVARLADEAHDKCFIANSLSGDIRVTANVVEAAS